MMEDKREREIEPTSDEWTQKGKIVRNNYTVVG